MPNEVKLIRIFISVILQFPLNIFISRRTKRVGDRFSFVLCQRHHPMRLVETAPFPKPANRNVYIWCLLALLYFVSFAIWRMSFGFVRDFATKCHKYSALKYSNAKVMWPHFSFFIGDDFPFIFSSSQFNFDLFV